ncbi:sensor histidine kinase [Parvularcula sp. LCG005]|uniref:sensor histidine kinase n=1 Tax=Parvularcula sp. LCG005 TaxID=3078805 RepID=UPI00294219EB|nr:HWE histidine kinase domain-containing protein [Parvularcula sp. LCG005]WOI54327.1 HWE histidine kinase domain-containing protein [Parvularcula sp. LCG005]
MPDRASEDQRLAALRRTGLLDTPHEETFDRYTRVAAALCDAPVALISLVDECRQWFKAAVGTDVAETPRDIAFCDYAIRGSALMEVPDATQDARFENNPLVTSDPHVRFYAGAPIELSTGERLGTLCVLDHVPRTLTEKQKSALTDLGGILVREIEGNRLAVQATEELQNLTRNKEAADERASSARLVARELNHRLGNLFAQVSALVAMADRETENRTDLVEVVRNRIMSLKSVSDVLVQEEWRSASLRQIADVSLSPILSESSDRSDFVIEGDDIEINEKAALHLALVFGELAANALRHGALGEARGKVLLRWRVEGEKFILDWIETGVTGTMNPSRRGFGSILLTRVAPASLMGFATREFTEQGLVYHLEADFAQLLPDPD